LNPFLEIYSGVLSYLKISEFYFFMNYKTRSTLDAGLAHIQDSPEDHGKLEMIVVRTLKRQRSTPNHVHLSARGGVEGDHWAMGCWKSLPDGSPDPSVQVAIMNSRCLELISPTKAAWALAGDNLIVDLDLSTHNLIAEQRIKIGTAILEITAVPHNGCALFKDRFGMDALKFISAPSYGQLRLRGVYAKVIMDGDVQIGDIVTKV
jgi:hypothetical protein